jgi:prevent-host-death family protein
MTKVGVLEAKTNFSQLIDRALNGEEIIVARHGRGLIRLVPLESETGLRPVGLHQKDVTEQELSFLDEPLAEDILATFFDVSKFDDLDNPRNSK